MSDEQNAPRIARFKPFYFKPVPGKTYLWCACGRSASQPFCDGSHKGTQYQPLKYTAAAGEKEVLLCGCKHSQMPPFCDGSHNNLRTVYELDDPDSESNRNKIQVHHHQDGRFELNGSCYVSRVSQVGSQEVGNLLWRPVVTSETGATYQSMFAIEVRTGRSPVVAFGDVEVVLFVTAGTGEIDISERRFPLRANTGIYVRRAKHSALTMWVRKPSGHSLPCARSASRPLWVDRCSRISTRASRDGPSLSIPTRISEWATEPSSSSSTNRSAHGP